MILGCFCRNVFLEDAESGVGGEHVREFTINPRVFSVFSEDVNSLLLAREYDYVRLFLKMKPV